MIIFVTEEEIDDFCPAKW